MWNLKYDAKRIYLWNIAIAKSLQLCPTLCDPIDGSPPGSPIPGILQAIILEWVAISFSNAWKGKVKVKLFSCVQLLATPWTAAYQAPPSMGFTKFAVSIKMSDSLQPHGLWPTRLFCPWDFPGKNTGVGCHFLLKCMKVKSESEVAQLCPTLSDPMDCSLSGSSVHGIFQARVLEWVAIAFSETILGPKGYYSVLKFGQMLCISFLVSFNSSILRLFLIWPM